MKKRMIIMLIGVAILFGLVVGYKAFKAYSYGVKMQAFANPVVTVSATDAKYLDWIPQVKASGSLRAVTGVNVTTELSGMVRVIAFTPGQIIKKGDLLAQLDIDPDTALLHQYQANAELAKITYERDSAQYAVKAVSKQTVDSDYANLKSTEAQVAQELAVIAQKTIRAPFSGRVGICLINPGQFLNPGDTVTMLQTYDPILVDFYVPQQSASQLKLGQVMNMTIDAFPEKVFNGKITTIDPGVDPNVRNIEAEATVENPDGILTPGMYAWVKVDTSQAEKLLTLPISALSFNPYGNLVYVITESGKDKKGQPNLTVKEKFVTIGEQRGDQVVILDGIKAGEKVVTSGQMKLKNGTRVAINNSIAPTDNPSPNPVDD